MKKTIILLAVLSLLISGCSVNFGKNKAVVLTPDEAKVKATDFINKNLMQAGSSVTITEVTEENGLYKMKVKLTNGQEINSYLTKDGKTFFPQSMEIAETEKQTETASQDNTTNQTNALADIPKEDKSKVELFVMSHCPYGTQIEKGILPVLAKLGNKIDFTLKFCDYSMHGEKELKEEMNQYCIQKNDPSKLQAYLKCFLADETKSADCMKSTGIDKGKIDSCVAATDKEYKITAGFKDQSTWVNGRFPAVNIHKADNDKYGVQGSPTLVINGKQASAGRDSNSLLQAVCAGFKNPPAECNEKLSTETPSPGFGFGTSDSSGSNAGCGG